MSSTRISISARRLALALVCSAAAAAAITGGLAHAASGMRLGHHRGVVTAGNSAGRSLHARLFASRAAGSNNLEYWGGPVMHSDANYTIYWEPAGHTTTSTYKNIINTYFANVAAADGVTSNDYSVATQYYDGAGAIAYQTSFGRQIVDTTPYPASGCVSPSGHPCLTDAQLETELTNVIANNGLPKGMGTEFFIFTPNGVATCFDSTSKDCSSGGQTFDYCAYHSSYGSGTGSVLYAVMPYAAVSGCNSGESPNGDPSDSTLNVVSHENIETITDPLGTAWFDSSGSEIGDKCAWNFGSSLGGTTGALYNEQISTGNYWLQQEWSNASSGCVQRMSSSQAGPLASFVYSPSSPRTGQVVSFNGSGSTDSGATITGYSWSFGDGSSGSGVTTSHTYSAAGTFTVKLTISDSSGKTSSVTHTVTVRRH